VAYYNFGQVTIELWFDNNRRPPPISACCMTTVLQIVVSGINMYIVDFARVHCYFATVQCTVQKELVVTVVPSW
jgi:hypothetical protein